MGSINNSNQNIGSSMVHNGINMYLVTRVCVYMYVLTRFFYIKNGVFSFQR